MLDDVRRDLARFYELIDSLNSCPGQGSRLSECSGGSCAWPKRGVYFFFEPGELRALTDLPRVVRVGTHAVGARAKSSLWGRLRAHRGGRSGGGNHRGSIFRLHVGAALLNVERQTLTTWGVGGSATREIKNNEAAHERRVSDYLGRMRVCSISVPDDPGPGSHRAVIERNAIALLSNKLEPLEPPSSDWLGRHSPRAEIRASGLWNLNYVDDSYDPAFLDLLKTYVSTSQLPRS
jgi:hypothetical protein